MNPAVEKLIAEKESERRREYEAAKAELAEKLTMDDCWDKEYSENGEFEENQPDGSVRRWRKVPVKLTDEEFERLMEYYPRAYHPGTPAVAVALWGCGWLALALGVIAGLVASGNILLIAGGVVLCLLFLALSKIIEKLHNIEQLLKKKE